MFSTLLRRWSCARGVSIACTSSTRKILTNLSWNSTRCFGHYEIEEDVERSTFIFGEPTEQVSGGEANKYKTFSDLGVCKQLEGALNKTHKTIPTIIQKEAYQSIVDQRDVILCAETGSGKTLSYLIPVLQQYYSFDGNNEGRIRRASFKHPSTVIVVPNKDLMAQVHNMCNEVLQYANNNTAEGSVQVTCGCVERVDSEWPYKGIEDQPDSHCPDILICTPAFLRAFVRGPRILEEDLFAAIQCCILDEADMLLEGSYKKDVETIFNVFKVTRRRIMKELEMKPHERIVQFIFSAATISTHGKFSVDQYLRGWFPRAERISTESFHKHHPRIEQDFLHVNYLDSETSQEKDVSNNDGSEEGSPVKNLKIKSGISPERVDLVFRALIGALPPREEEANNEWDRDQWKGNRSSIIKNIPPTMIFANTAGKARDLAAALNAFDGGVLDGTIAEFHKLRPTYDKQEALEKFRNHAQTGVKILVCTDAAARGLDLPSVEHVIQAEFALNVVQHLHRNGRASRAGKKGRATVIFDDSSIDLVQSILSSDSDNERSIESSFSRRRGFRRTVKRKAKRLEKVIESDSC